MPFMLSFPGFSLYFIIGMVIVYAIIMLLMMGIMRKMIVQGGCCPCSSGHQRKQNEQILENQWYR